MENDSATPDSPKQTRPAPTRDPLIRYSVFAALGCAAVCMVFTLLYVFSYSLDSSRSFERHFDSYLASGNSANLSTVLGLHMAQNRMFLQSCGMVAGIFFAFLGLALFLVGIQGTVDASGQVKDYSSSSRRLAPGGIILFTSMIFVGVSAMRPIDFVPGPTAAPTTTAPSANIAPPINPPVASPAPQATSPEATTATPTQSQVQPSTPPFIRPQPPSAQLPSQAIGSQTAASQTSATKPAPARPPAARSALVAVNQGPNAARQHRFQP